MSSGSKAQGSMFEALFSRALKPDGEFAAELKACGFDPARVNAEYPTQVWVDCLKVARRRAFGSLEEGPAWRALGKAFVDGFLATLSGKIVAVAVPFLSPEGMLKRMPRYMTLGRSDVSLTVQVAPGHCLAVLEDPFLIPAEFLAGILVVGLEKVRATPTITVKELAPGKSELDISWS